MPKFDPKKRKWYIGTRKRKYYKSKAAAFRSYGAYMAKKKGKSLK